MSVFKSFLKIAPRKTKNLEFEKTNSRFFDFPDQDGGTLKTPPRIAPHPRAETNLEFKLFGAQE